MVWILGDVSRLPGEQSIWEQAARGLAYFVSYVLHAVLFLSLLLQYCMRLKALRMLQIATGTRLPACQLL